MQVILRRLTCPPRAWLCCTEHSWHVSADVKEFSGLAGFLGIIWPSASQLWLCTRTVSGSFKTGKERADANPLSPTPAMPGHELCKSLNAQPWLATPDGATHRDIVKHLILRVRKRALSKEEKAPSMKNSLK